MILKLFNLKIPIHVLNLILDKTSKKEYIHESQRGKKFYLTHEGKDFVDGLETEREVERRINNLASKIKEHFLGKNRDLSSEKIQELLLKFINKKLETFIEFLNPEAVDAQIEFKTMTENEIIFVEFIRIAESQDPINYNTIEDLILGSIVSATLFVKRGKQLEVLTSYEFKRCQLYLYTNYLALILNLDLPERSKPALELFQIIKRYNFKLKVFSFTVDELCRLLSRYGLEKNLFPRI